MTNTIDNPTYYAYRESMKREGRRRLTESTQFIDRIVGATI